MKTTTTAKMTLPKIPTLWAVMVVNIMYLLVFRHTLFVYVSVGVPSHAVCLCDCWCSVTLCLCVYWCSVTRCLSMWLLVFRHAQFVYVSIGAQSHAVCLCVYWCSVTRCLSVWLLVFRHTLFVCVYWCSVIHCLSVCLLVSHHTLFVNVSTTWHHTESVATLSSCAVQQRRKRNSTLTFFIYAQQEESPNQFHIWRKTKERRKKRKRRKKVFPQKTETKNPTQVLKLTRRNLLLPLVVVISHSTKPASLPVVVISYSAKRVSLPVVVISYSAKRASLPVVVISYSAKRASLPVVVISYSAKPPSRTTGSSSNQLLGKTCFSTGSSNQYSTKLAPLLVVVVITVLLPLHVQAKLTMIDWFHRCILNTVALTTAAFSFTSSAGQISSAYVCIPHSRLGDRETSLGLWAGEGIVAIRLSLSEFVWVWHDMSWLSSRQWATMPLLLVDRHRRGSSGKGR